jgi:hypothetical protein
MKADWLRAVPVLFVLLLSGCATWEGINFGLSVMQADTEMSISYGDGKAVIAAEQANQGKVRAHFGGR